MSDRKQDRLLDAAIRGAIKSMPGEKVPEGFSARVMQNLEPKRPSVWLQFKTWLFGPQSLTVRPIHLVPVATCMVALLVLGILHVNPSVVQDDEVRLHTVRFMLNDHDMKAKTVSVIGSFNNWQAEKSTMWYNEDEGIWMLEATLPPGDHEYVFLVDGEKLVPDPQAAMFRDDGFGNKNSILFLNGDHAQPM